MYLDKPHIQTVYYRLLFCESVWKESFKTEDKGPTSPAALKGHSLHICIKDACDEGRNLVLSFYHHLAHVGPQIIACLQELLVWKQITCIALQYLSMLLNLQHA